MPDNNEAPPTKEQLELLMAQGDGGRAKPDAVERTVRAAEQLKKKMNHMSPAEIEEELGHRMNNENIPSDQPGKMNPF